MNHMQAYLNREDIVDMRTIKNCIIVINRLFDYSHLMSDHAPEIDLCQTLVFTQQHFKEKEIHESMWQTLGSAFSWIRRLMLTPDDTKVRTYVLAVKMRFLGPLNDPCS